MDKNKQGGLAAAEDIFASPPGGEATPLADSAQGKKKVRKYLLSGGFLIVLIVVTFYVIFRDTSPGELLSVLRAADPRCAAGGFAAMAGYILFRAFNTGMAARCIKARMTAGEMIQYSCIGFFYSGITPSSIGGQPMEFCYMCRDRLSASKSTLVLFLTNAAYQLVLVTLGIVMFCCKAGYIASINGSIVVFFFISLSFNLAMLLLLVGVLYSETALKKFLDGAIKFFARVKIIKDVEGARAKVEAYIAEFRAGAQLIKRNRRRFVRILLGTFGQTLCSLSVPCFVYMAFGLKGWSFFDVLAVNTVVFVTVSLFPLPGAVGAAESGFVLLLATAFGKYIVPAMVLSRFISFYTIMVLCGCVAAFAQLRRPYNIAARTAGCPPGAETAGED